ncbi:MAG TPA: LysM peptidoglycan-binding domain-containing protein [Candidatus Limnocylindria bacterium]|nr:LysM peptidoglycan-binding domain-containing protein [Candidatus Limnocylindria bacterium]
MSQRPRLLFPALGLAATLTAGPFLAGVALAADPIVVVQRGDTLSGISKRQGVAISDIVALNGLADPNRIYVGQRLRLTAPAPAAPAAAAPPAPAAPAAATAPSTTVHTVARGESLWTIARRYGVSVSAIVAANGISNPSRIYGGQQLTIPGTAPAPAPAAPAATPPAASTPSAPAMPPSMARLVAGRDAMRQLIVAEAQRFGVPPAFALAVAWQESGWRQEVVSSAGAVGVMQLMPATGAWVAEAMLGTPVDINDTTHNVRAGVRLLAHYLQRYQGDRDLVLAAYYQGQYATDRHGIYGVTRPYIASIRLLEVLFGG